MNGYILLDADALLPALAQAAARRSAVVVGSRLGITVYALPSGSLLATGPGYRFTFAPIDCGIDL